MRPYFACLFLLGCVDLPPYSTVEDLRVLAIRAEPPELRDGPLAESIEFTALVADPRHPGAEIELQWEFCPVLSHLACLDYDELIADRTDGPLLETLGAASAEILRCPTLRPQSRAGVERLRDLLAALESDDYLETHYRGPVVTDTYAVGPFAADDQDLGTLDSQFLTELAADLVTCGVPPSPSASFLPTAITDLHLVHLLSVPIESVLGVKPSVVLTARRNGEELRAQKRIPLHWRDPRSPFAMMEVFVPGIDFGVRLCNEVGETDCVPVRSREPNLNPELEKVRMVRSEEPVAPDDQGWVSVGHEVIEMKPQEVIRLLPVLTSDSYQHYQITTVDPQTLGVRIEDTVEEPSAAWFSTGGTLGDELTWPKTTRDLDTTFEAPEETGDINLWLVVRDHRGGVTWRALEVAVR